MFQWAIRQEKTLARPLSLVIADYNPTVLQLVTLPNFILTWALAQQATTPALESAFAGEDELELTSEVLEAFQAFLAHRNMNLYFLSGAWSQEFVDLTYSTTDSADTPSPKTIILGAETIYSPFALQAFTETVFSILERESRSDSQEANALVGAKRLYFGVGGSLDDFVVAAEDRGAIVSHSREETEGVRRGVVRCSLEKKGSAG